MNRRRAAVTGMGVLAPNGLTLVDFWAATTGGKSGIDRIDQFNTDNFDVKIGAEVKDFCPGNYVPPAIFRKMDRFAQFGVCAAKLALDDAQVPIDDSNRHRIGVIVGSGLGGILFHEEQILRFVSGGDPSRVVASSVPKISPNAVSGYIGIAFGITGPNYAVSTACSSGANAIGLGLTLLRSGVVDVCVVGGVEAPFTPFTHAAFQALGCLAHVDGEPAKASRPFDKNRSGFVMGEGAGMLVLEDPERAKARGARAYAELRGFGSNCGAYNMAAPRPDGEDAAEAMRQALDDAELIPTDIDYVNAHGTATQLNDVVETRAIKSAFNGHASRLWISSTKSMIGHSIGASGAIEAIVACLSLTSGKVHPTANLDTPDPECDLDYVAGPCRKARLHNVMSNSFGFGSNNAVLVFSAAGENQR